MKSKFRRLMESKKMYYIDEIQHLETEISSLKSRIVTLEPCTSTTLANDDIGPLKYLSVK